MMKLTNSILATAALFLVITLMCVFVDAQGCPSTPSLTCENAQSGTAGQRGRCPISWLSSAFKTNPNTVSDIYWSCAPASPTDSTCCNDPCQNFRTTTQCLAQTESAGSTSPKCIFMPASPTLYECKSKFKLCALNDFDTCSKIALCEFDNATQTCGLKAQFSAAESQDFSLAECPALHGAVVAFLVLMFISLVGAIIFVIIVVVIKQKKADEEEKKAAEEAAAAEAAAKAQQEEQDDF